MNDYMEDEINNYIQVSEPEKKSVNIDNKKIIIGLIILVIIGLVVFIMLKKSSSSYSSYEKKMITLAKEYVTSKGIQAETEKYVSVSELNMSLPNNCSLLSGVIYKGDNYTPYLLCNDYESEIVNNEVDERTDFKLVGNDVLVLLKGMEYHELGYKCSEEVSITSSNMEEAGVYNIYYVLDNSSLVFTRKVIVITDTSLSNLYPAINVSNENPVKIEKGNQYKEQVTAIDAIDGDVTNKIIEVNNIDVNTIGEYKVVYSVRNSLGYTTSVEKKVTVVDSLNEEIEIITSLSNDNITNESIKINVSITGNNYQYTKLPEGTTTTDKEFEYPIDENGKYEFIAVDNQGNEISKVIDVTNIDKTVPEGKCEAVLQNDKTSISVTMNTFNYIVGYNYYTDNNSSGYIEYNTYNSSTKNPTNIYVMVKDYIGNEGKITCTKTDKQSHFDPQGYRTVINGKPRLHMPIADALARKGYTVNDLNMCIYNRVKEAGPYTRYGVAAAAYGIIDCTYTMTGYVLAYNHSSGKVEEEKTVSGGTTNYCGGLNKDICGKLGINTRWGSKGGSCGRDSEGNVKECWHGLNCATAVRWAMCNGGMDLCSRGSASSHGMASTKYFPEADGVSITGKTVKYYSGTNLTNYSADALVRMLKPGDVVASSASGGHVFTIVGYDDEAVYTAEDGYFMRKLKYETLVNGQLTYRLLFLDNYYANANNRNNLYG